MSGAPARIQVIEDLKSVDILGTPFLRPVSCNCPGDLYEYLRDLTREANAVLGPEKQVHFVYVPPTIQTNAPPLNGDPFRAVRRDPCPVHSVHTNTITTMHFTPDYMNVSAWVRLQNGADMFGRSVELAPESRTEVKDAVLPCAPCLVL